MQGVTQQLLEDELQMNAEEILQTSNSLLQRNLIDMFSGGKLIAHAAYIQVEGRRSSHEVSSY